MRKTQDLIESLIALYEEANAGFGGKLAQSMELKRGNRKYKVSIILEEI